MRMGLYLGIRVLHALGLSESKHARGRKRHHEWTPSMRKLCSLASCSIAWVCIRVSLVESACHCIELVNIGIANGVGLQASLAQQATMHGITSLGPNVTIGSKTGLLFAGCISTKHQSIKSDFSLLHIHEHSLLFLLLRLVGIVFVVMAVGDVVVVVVLGRRRRRRLLVVLLLGGRGGRSYFRGPAPSAPSAPAHGKVEKSGEGRGKWAK